MADTNSGVLVIAHGMRDPAGKTAFFEIVDWVRELLPQNLVEGAFLEFAQPTITEAVAKLASQGTTTIAAVPMFLMAVGHTMDDIPVAVAEAEKGSGFGVQGSGLGDQGSGVRIQIKAHVGLHRRVVELSAVRFRQALEGRGEIPSKETLAIIAAHGSPEPEAIDELAEFALRRATLTPVDRVEPCFAVLGKPQLTDVLKESATSSYKRIVVQPHLLLHGRYSEMIRTQVEAFGRDYPNIDWVVTEPLGPDKLLAQAVAEIVKDEG